MSVPVIALPPVKLPPGPSPLTPEQIFWRSFKTQQLVPSPSNSPITHISCPSFLFDPASQPSDYFSVTTGARVQIYSIRSRRLVKTISRFDDVAHSADIRRDGRVMAVGDESGAIQVFDLHSRAILKTWNEHKQPVWVTKFSTTGLKTLMSASDDQTVRLWDLPSQESTLSFVGHQDYVRAGAFMPGQASGLVVSGSYDQTVKLWDPRASTGAVMTFKHAAPVECVLPMPSGTTLLAAADNQISVLDIVAGRPLNMVQNHQKTITSLCFASKGSRLVSGGLDGHVKIFETTGWNVVAGSKYPSPVLAVSVISSGHAREDRHLAVGLQSGLLSIKTRLSGQQKVKERERQKEMRALIEGSTDKLDNKRAKIISSGMRRRLRGHDFRGEGADVIIEDKSRTSRVKAKPWEVLLRSGKYSAALDKVLNEADLYATTTLLVALRHRSAIRTALSGRDELTLQPIFEWVCTFITNPRYVRLCVDIGALILDLYSTQMGQSKDIDNLLRRLHTQVRREVNRSQQAWQIQGMLGLLLES
ncbi:hypothetical protein MMC13_000360 [Lambiella insularis]|nr:hypothetical protein [Lambiella insularis]